MPQEIVSSYTQSDYGEVFGRMILAWRPTRIVELGVLHGYSTINLARGAKFAREVGLTSAHIDAYDLFEDYPYNHGTQAGVQKLLDEEGLTEFVTLSKGDAFEVHKNYGLKDVHMLHVDLSNTGETLRRIIQDWDSKLPYGGIILFEGGSDERDRVEWMVKYGKEPIKVELEKNPIINSKYVYGTYLDFPSMTVLLKKRE